MENTGLKVQCFLSGRYGGTIQMEGYVAEGKIDIVIFFRDPLTAQSHEPDMNALMRVCDIHQIPLASHIQTARLILKSFMQEKNQDEV